MKPTIHLNGTSPNELLDKALTATHALRAAIDAMYAMAPNARDYYPQGTESYRQATLEHGAMVGAVKAALLYVEELAEYVSDAIN